MIEGQQVSTLGTLSEDEAREIRAFYVPRDHDALLDRIVTLHDDVARRDHEIRALRTRLMDCYKVLGVIYVALREHDPERAAAALHAFLHRSQQREEAS